MSILAIILVIGLPLITWIAYFLNKRRLKVKKDWYKSLETYLVSFLCSGWITVVLSKADWFKEMGFLDSNDIILMNNVKNNVGLIIPLPIIPIEIKLFVIILVIIYLTLLP